MPETEATVKKAEPYKRYRLSVPVNDTSVIEWLAAQDTISYSLRVLIKDAIARQGYTDVTCRPPSAKSPGRPRRESTINAENAFAAAERGELFGDGNYNQQTSDFVQPVQQVLQQVQQQSVPIQASAQTVYAEPALVQQPIQPQVVQPAASQQPVQQVQPAPVQAQQPVQPPVQTAAPVDTNDDDDDMAFAFGR